MTAKVAKYRTLSALELDKLSRPNFIQPSIINRGNKMSKVEDKLEEQIRAYDAEIRGYHEKLAQAKWEKEGFEKALLIIRMAQAESSVNGNLIIERNID